MGFSAPVFASNGVFRLSSFFLAPGKKLPVIGYGVKKPCVSIASNIVLASNPKRLGFSLKRVVFNQLW